LIEKSLANKLPKKIKKLTNQNGKPKAIETNFSVQGNHSAKLRS
jgi:hypothetical protein